VGILDSIKLPSIDDIVNGIKKTAETTPILGPILSAGDLLNKAKEELFGEFKVLPYLSEEQQKQFLEQVKNLPSFTPTPIGASEKEVKEGPIGRAVVEAEQEALKKGAKTPAEVFAKAMEPQNLVPKVAEEETKQVKEKVVVPTIQYTINLAMKTLEGATKGATEGILDENTKKLLIVGGIVAGGLIIYGLVKD
jgi:hypothetical protein